MTDLYCGDCLEVMRDMPDNSVDAVVTDPPYGLAFMGKRWDYDVPAVEVWAECLRLLKPGGHLLAFAGTRTQHRMACRIEDAGFEIRDMIAWVYGSGFPKSLDISKAIDKAAGAEREVVGRTTVAGMFKQAYQVKQGYRPNNGNNGYAGERDGAPITAPATSAACEWQGWGTALKPALEPITLARKPLIGTVAANVLEYGTGGLNIDACRVEPTGELLGGGGETAATFANKEGWSRPWMKNAKHAKSHAAKVRENVNKATMLGRWPANLIHDGSEEATAGFPETKTGGPGITKQNNNGHTMSGPASHADRETIGYNDSGSAARFFYCAKASKAEREAGLNGFEIRQTIGGGGLNNTDDDVCGKYGSIKAQSTNYHPTVKPVALMRYLCRLVTPPGGIVLDPFMGSGTTGIAAKAEALQFIGIELDPEYFAIAEARINATQAQQELCV